MEPPLNYLLVEGPLVVMAQTAWGGVYVDPAERAEAWAQQVERISRLLDAFSPPADASPSARLVVCASDFHSVSSWGWIEVGPGARKELQRASHDGAFDEAMRWLADHGGR